MYVYWGYASSGTCHIRYYALFNGMNLMVTKYKNFFKTKNKINQRGITPNGVLWVNRDMQKIMYYRKKDKFLSCESKYYTDDFTKLEYGIYDNYINPILNEEGAKSGEYIKKQIEQNKLVLTNSEIFMGGSSVGKKPRDNFTDKDIEKYLTDEYKGKDIYYRAFMQHYKYLTHEPYGYHMLNDNADEIFDEVDLIMTSSLKYFCIRKTIIPPNVLKKLQKAINIIPYKSNIFEWVLSYVDGFSHITKHKYKESPIEIYKKNKNFIWDYLDHQLNEPIKIANFLSKNNIPYKFFDIDTDSYNEMFGGDYELDRDYTSFKPSYVGYDDRYNEVVNIVKEYISLRNLSQPYKPIKL